MWILLHDCFFSIVSKDCAPDELMVRARREGDIQKLWPDAKVTRYTKSDYLFRAAIKKVDITSIMADEIEDIDYSNFKDTVKDNRLHNAYLSIWTALSALQPTRPYSGMFKKSRK